MIKRILYLLILFPLCLVAQEQKTISGNITDAVLNDPIVGATVYASSKIIGNNTNVEGYIQGSMIGATTDENGDFSFNAPKEIKYIIVSYIGFETQKVDVSKKSTDLMIELSEMTEGLDEVIVTGYQKIEKRKSTSSYAKIKTTDLRQTATANVDQMLSGQISGVAVQTTNGSPGAPVKIQIRGTSTLNGSSDPLWVLDGIPLEGNDVPKDFNDKDNIDNLKSYAIAGINPDDIEDITILKDASATSIYGARAANGVIVITTKKGKEGAMRINFNANTFVTQKPDFNKLNLMNTNQKIDFELLLAGRSDLKYREKQGQVARILDQYGAYEDFQKNGFNSINPQAQKAINNLRKSTTNWGDELYRATVNQQYGLSVSGGNSKLDYYVSLGYFNEEGTTKGTGLTRYNITVKNNYAITNKLKVGFSIFANRNKRHSYITGADAYTNPANYTRNANPYLKIKDANGNYIYDLDLLERYNLNLEYNALEERTNTNYQLIANSIKPIFNVDYALTGDIKIASQLGMQFDFGETEKMAMEESYYTRKYRFSTRYINEKGETDYFLPKGGIIQNWNNNLFQYNWKTTVNYGTSFNNIHEIDVMLGTEFRENKQTEIHTKGFGFNHNTLTTKQITGDLISTRDKKFKAYNKKVLENAFTSFFGTASYTFDRRYTLFGSLRYDGSNLFGVNPKYRYLPLWSVAGSWNVAREYFMVNIEAINELKIRGSYGVQGNIDKTTSPFVIGVYNELSILPGITEEGITVFNAPNKNLRWEKTISSNIGLDLGLFQNKIYVSADYYHRKSSDLIGIKAIPLESGFNFISTNWATLSNRGFELAIHTTNIENDNFKWKTIFNISHNKNTVDEIQIKENNLYPSIKGYSVNSVFAIKTAGIDSNGLPLFYKNGKKQTAVDFYNLSKGTDGSQLTRKQHRELYTYVGDKDPEFTGGFINKFYYKNFSLSIATNFNINQTVKRTPTYHPTWINPAQNYSTEVLKAGTGNYPGFIGATSPGFETNLVYNWYNLYDTTYKDLDIWIKKISYIRINSIKLGYSFPKEYLDKLKLSSLHFNIEGRNLFVFGTDYDGYFDPETYGSLYAQPIPKTVSLGCNLSF